jgi:tRNA(Ile2) C34 agmatinyltransferase TiaS
MINPETGWPRCESCGDEPAFARCPQCGMTPLHVLHADIAKAVERDLRFTLELQRRRAA